MGSIARRFYCLESSPKGSSLARFPALKKELYFVTFFHIMTIGAYIIRLTATLLNCRLERVKLSCMYSKVKIAGTLLCVVGALTMSIIQSTTSVPAKEAPLSSPSPDTIFDREKIIGCLYLISAVFALSSSVVLQVTSIRVVIVAFIKI